MCDYSKHRYEMETRLVSRKPMIKQLYDIGPWSWPLNNLILVPMGGNNIDKLYKGNEE